LTIKKAGYYGETQWIRIKADTKLRLEMVLTKITGFLNLQVQPAGAAITVDDASVNAGVTELPVGTHHLAARLFGYEEWRQTVLITEKATTEVAAALKEAVFNVRNLHVSRQIFNPTNPGTLGQTIVSFEVTTFGEATAFIYDRSQQAVFQYYFPSFTTWDQSFNWDGKDNRGTLLDDGEYRVVINAGGKNNPQRITQEVSVSIDRSAVISFRPVWSGNSGMLYSGTPDVLPKGNFQVSSLFLGHMERMDNDLAARFPVQVGFRFSPVSRVEVDAQATAIIQSTGHTPYSLGLAGKFLILKKNGVLSFSTAFTAKGTYLKGETFDSLTNFTGFSLGAPLQLTWGAFNIIFMPEVTLSPNRISYDREYSTSLYIWGYGRAGILLDFKAVTTGLSGSVRTIPFTEGFALQFPLAVGYELHFIIPDTQAVVTAGIAGEFDSEKNFYIMAGVGIGLLN
ncbi:MAG: PEGA domain-containing protein, partial [Spirochaetota bacterium]